MNYELIMLGTLVVALIAIVAAFLIARQSKKRSDEREYEIFEQRDAFSQQIEEIAARNSSLLSELSVANEQIRALKEREEQQNVSFNNIVAQVENLRDSLASQIEQNSQLLAQASGYKEQINGAKLAENRLLERQKELETQIAEFAENISQIREKNSSLSSEISSYQEQINSLKKREELINQQNEQQQEQFKTIFENVAHEIIEKRSEKFLADSSQSVTRLVEPLARELSEFGKRVDRQNIDSAKEGAALRTELGKLMELNHKLGNEATSLVKAIKGEYNPKFQGDWGEMILEKILTNSGLTEGEHYFLQESTRADEGNILRPDVIVRYPDGREVIIDSKVSMTAYVRYSSATTVEEAETAEKEHIISVRRHIDSLSAKRYEYKNESLDFVMMFMAVEPAYMLALTSDTALWEYAYKKKILLVTPTHLITALKLIYDLWSRDAQNKNAIEIAKRGALMLDKFAGFLTDMEAIKRNIDQTTRSYDNAMNKLSTGSGNLIRQAEMLSDLGVRSGKKLVTRE
ncbi:MAG: DNA recombination protein RmuC [Rikenellaceae bacterium]